MAVPYSSLRSEFAYDVTRTLNRTVPAYRTSVQSYQRTVPVPLQKRHSVPYLFAKIEVYRTYVPYGTVILAFNYSQL